MTNLVQAWPSVDARRQNSDDSKEIYFSLSKATHSQRDVENARFFLSRQLADVKKFPDELPAEPGEIATWITAHAEAVGTQYAEYLASRKKGGARRFFTNKSHALYFLNAVAPTKLVDGAWLYGLLPRWNNQDFHALIKIYLEELGDGVPGKNHVALYKNLLTTHGCEHWHTLSSDHFVQGAIQLALAYDVEHFLPELIGYNLGYEQLPLHLLITAYELNELGIDPYYFTLHVTVDNTATGHAHKALQGLQQLMPRVGNADAFYRRVMDGYRLNELGANTKSVIASFDLQTELVRILAAKSVVGKNMHSDYCRVGGRTVNDWLSDPAQIPDFLQKLEDTGWIKRGEAPENSRFWRLIQSDRAEMFGVFTVYEQQILQDWISTVPRKTDMPAPTNLSSYRARQRSLEALAQPSDHSVHVHATRGVIRHHRPERDAGQCAFNPELRLLEEKLALCSKQEAMQKLIPLMSPATHHTAAGLMATRMFSKLLG